MSAPTPPPGSSYPSRRAARAATHPEQPSDGPSPYAAPMSVPGGARPVGSVLPEPGPPAPRRGSVLGPRTGSPTESLAIPAAQPGGQWAPPPAITPQAPPRATTPPPPPHRDLADTAAIDPDELAQYAAQLDPEPIMTPHTPGPDAWSPETQAHPAPSFDDVVTAAPSAPVVAADPDPAQPEWSEDDLFPERTTKADPKKTGRPTPPRKRTAGDVVRGIVGVFGELFVTLGVFLLLFVVWELWYSDVQGNNDQKQEVEQLAAQDGWTDVTTPPGGPVPLTDVKCTVGGQNPAECGGDTPPMDVGEHDSEPFAALQVPRWGSTYDEEGTYRKPVAEGVDPETVLNVYGVGHYNANPQTQQVGEVGNFALAAHRRTHGAPFRYVQDLEVGDDVIVQTGNYYYVYQVKASQIVYPNDIWVVGPDPVDPATGQPVIPGDDKRLLTLTTCHPEFSTAQRYIIWAELAYWVPKNVSGEKVFPTALDPSSADFTGGPK